MADNVTLNAGSGGDTIAADDVSNVKYQLIQLVVGADGVAKSLVTGSTGLPITDASGSITVDNGGTFAVQESGGALTALQLIDNLVLAEDAAHASGDPGVQFLAVRKATPANVSGADGDYEPLQVSAGRLWASATIDAALPTGSNVIGAVTQSGTWNVGTVTAVTSITNAVAVTDNSGSLTVDNAALSVTGGGAEASALRVTIASDSTGVLSVDDNGGSLTVDGTVAVSGTVTIAGAVTNAGTFAVQVDGNALTSLQLIDDVVLAEDAGHSSGDKGVMALAVRNDSDASLCGTTLDYTPLQVDSNGYLKVNIKAGAGSGGTASTDDAAFTAASGSGTPMMGFVTSDSVDSGDVGVVGMLANRQLKVTLYDSAGAELSVGGGTQYDEDTAHVSGDKLTMAGVVRADTAASLAGTDGDRTALIVDANGRLHVQPGTTAVTQSGTWTVQPGNTANSTPWLVTASQATAASLNATVVGGAAHDAAVAGNPLLLGIDGRHARATAVSADADATRLAGDRYGRLSTVGVELSRAVVQATASGNTALVSAPGAGNKIRLKRVELSNSHASTAVTVGVCFASGTVFSKAYLPAAGGAKVINLGEDYTLGGDNEALNVNLSAGSAQVECTAFYETVAT